jgi:peptidoglycan glycosyltransferase
MVRAMALRSWRAAGLVLLGALLCAATITVLALYANADDSRAEAQPPREDPAARRRALLAGFDPLETRVEGERVVSDLPSGNKALLSIDLGLQDHLVRELGSYEVPYAAVVAIDPRTGRVLAYVSHSSANPDAGDLARDPTPPTASVFKLVSAAALVEHGVTLDETVCFHGGSSRLTEADLVDSDLDRQCATLPDAVGSSINTVFAKLALRHLDSPTLERYAGAFGFGHAIPFDVPTRPSPGEVPDRTADPLEFARTSAGFWHMHMSPLHGALIAATFANGGVMMRPTMVDRVVDASGAELLAQEPEVFRRVVGANTASLVGQMMERTTTSGTGRRSFYDRAGRPFLPGIRVAGKTGTLSAADPYRGYTWWVGFAPLEAPRIAVASLVVNRPEWRIKASYVAREALRFYLVERAPAPANSTAD